MTTNNMKQDISISMSNLNYLDGAVSQIHGLTTFIVGNDNHKVIPAGMLLNLLWTASERIEVILKDCNSMYFGEIPKEQLKFEQLLIQAKSVLDALRIDNHVGSFSPDTVSNVIWLADSLLEDAIKELDKMPTRPDEQAA
ncbi:MAG: hypothetical protein ACTH36_04955 [Pseudoalteromonas nigrifaciens]